MRPHLQSVILLLLVYNVITISGQNYQLRTLATDDGTDRDKRALDLGTLVRNLLMKSAYASNTKAAVSRNLINLKTATTTTTTPRPTTRRRPVTTTLAPFFAKKSFLFPFDLSSFSGGFQPINKFNNGPVSGSGPGPLTVGPRGGYFNFDYDYVDQTRSGQPLPRRRRPPTTTTAAPTTTTTTTAAPPALPLKRRPQRPKFPNYDYYDDDYDYGEVEPTTPAASPPPPPPTRSRPRRPQQNQATPLPPPRNGARQDRPFRLRNPAIYQYAQTNDFSTNNNNNGNGSNDAATVDNAASTADDNTANPNANNQLTTNDDTSQDTNEADNENEAAFDPSNLEDSNDSSDNSNPNTNGNGSNGNDISLNDVDNNDNGEPTGQIPLFDDNNNSAPPNNAPSAPPPPSVQQPNFGAQFINPRNFNGRGPAQPGYGAQFINSRNFNGRGGGPPLSQLIQPFGLPTDYQNFQYPSFNDYSTQYQQPQPSSPVGYSVRYY